MILNYDEGLAFLDTLDLYVSHGEVGGCTRWIIGWYYGYYYVLVKPIVSIVKKKMLVS